MCADSEGNEYTNQYDRIQISRFAKNGQAKYDSFPHVDYRNIWYNAISSHYYVKHERISLLSLLVQMQKGRNVVQPQL